MQKQESNYKEAADETPSRRIRKSNRHLWKVKILSRRYDSGTTPEVVEPRLEKYAAAGRNSTLQNL
jgi:hypothetical protein